MTDDHEAEVGHNTNNRPLVFPKFGVSSPEWKEVQRIRRAGLADRADAVQAHFISEEESPQITQFQDFDGECLVVDGQTVTLEDLKTHPQRHLIEWMIERGNVTISLGL